MEIITGHINIDFDCLASILAAGKLYPQAQMVLPGVIGRDVREFLNLYRDTFDFKLSKEIDIEKVSRLIIVDTHSKSRIGEEFRDIITRPGVDIIVYDHHPHCEDGIEAGVRHIADVGANTTLLVEEIINKNIEISSLEATVFALGIYVDTNCLTFDGTKARDAYALAFLLSRGANLQVIETYLVSHLTPKQQVLIENLAKNLKLIDIKGFKIAVSMVELDDYVDDAAYITRKLLVERDYDSFFSIVRMGNKTYIVGRSIADEINIGHIMSFLDGAGHPGAGSAKTNEKDLGKIFIKLEAILKENISPVTTAKDIMSSPVKTVPDDSTINDVNKIMLRYGHSGLPVVRDGILSGIISRRDIEKARVHGFGNSPVKAYMSKNVVTISPDTPIKEIQHHFIEHNIGRLPVLEDSQLVGIITRTDIIRTLFGENPPGWYKRNYVDNQELNRYRRHNLSDRIDMLPDKVRNILVHAGRTADEDGINIYVVGGFVRDLILGVENLDIDIVVEGDAILFAGK
ncbi:MAG: CBS domain-containing protein, partial [Bacillota bacterium]